MLDKLQSGAFIVIVFGSVSLFAYFFGDAFMATVDFLDSARCNIGMTHYCADE